MAHFEAEPSDMTVSAGQIATFDCRVSSVTSDEISYEVEWLKNDQPLNLDKNRMKILPSGLLEIVDVQSSDVGTYQCTVTASSQQQHRSRSAQLKLDYGRSGGK